MFKNLKLDWAGKALLGLGAAAVTKNFLDQNKMREDLSRPGAKEILAEALEASHVWQREISRPGATAAGVVKKLGLLNTTRKGFEKITGVAWPF